MFGKRLTLALLFSTNRRSVCVQIVQNVINVYVCAAFMSDDVIKSAKKNSSKRKQQKHKQTFGGILHTSTPGTTEKQG